MKIQEVKSIIQKKEPAELQTILVELYRLLPKKFIQEKEIDNLLQNTKTYIESRKKTGNQTLLSLDQIEKEVKEFIHNAYAQNYVSANKVIKKADRPKWRFVVKRLVNQLMDISATPDHTEKAAELLESIYKLLCYASANYTFNTETPFQSVQISQADFFRKVLTLKWKVESPELWLKHTLPLFIEQTIDSETYTEELLTIIFEFFSHAPLLETAVEECLRTLEQMDILTKEKTKASDPLFIQIQKSRQNDIVQLLFMCQMKLSEYERAIILFKQYFIPFSLESKLYKLLKWLKTYNLTEHWIKEYEHALQNSIVPRKELTFMYRHLLEHHVFPDPHAFFLSYNS